MTQHCAVGAWSGSPVFRWRRIAAVQLSADGCEILGEAEPEQEGEREGAATFTQRLPHEGRSCAERQARRGRGKARELKVLREHKGVQDRARDQAARQRANVAQT